SADGGANWQTATVKGAQSRYDWVLWSAALELARPGVIELLSRASDSAGNTQPVTRDPRRADLYAYNVCGRVRCVVI
ncbi:MAG TPA: molybdopterin containing oxidoreductase, partial [Terriglobia bacterium]|nr:molybdopterin containing oxidoreductase [Terriglobia bacterium]